MTEKLFYEDQYMTDFQAEVVAEDGDRVALNRTAFYPEGGGQPWDTGTLIVGNETFRVLEVHEKDEIIWHRLDRTISVGSAVFGHIDWERRFDHMQQHSGEHIVSGMICKEFNCNNVGFHMGTDVVTIDYDAEISYEQALKIESEANNYIWANHKFQVTWPDAGELATINYRSKKELSGKVRITTWPGADCCACCGTHVAFSGEVGLVKLASAHKFHEGTRLELYCGKRAFDFLNKSWMANKEVSDLLSTKEELTPKIVSKQLEDYITLRSEMTGIENKYFELLAEKYKGGANAVIVSKSLSPEQGRRLADVLANVVPGLAVVFTKSGTSMRYAIISRNMDVMKAARIINQKFDGKGGGKGGFAQGTVNKIACEECVARELEE